MSLHHRTDDPVQRAGHIADRLEKQREDEHIAMYWERPTDWPEFWLRSYDEVLRELVGATGTQSEGESA